ncbi:centrosomal protein of 70 kDa-like [Haliotis cracherodii]|uniref:centrosomal protein of 70 kDa-like n=1 Tax=Haliotis cracherodii TaxID=6455 RepID=UPI0039E84392
MASFGKQRRWISPRMTEPRVDVEDNMDITGYEGEVKAWCNVNHLLRLNGYAKVKLLHPADVSLATDNVVCIDLATSESLRDALTSLLSDQPEQQSSMMEKYQNKVKDLKVMLECSRARVQELEQDAQSRLSYHKDEGEMLRNTKNVIVSKHRQLEQQSQEQELEIDMLRRKLKRMVDEETRRINRQNQVFQEFKKRTSRAHSVMDEKLLDIIDAYEGQVNTLQRELDHSRSGLPFGDEDSEESYLSHHPNPSQNVKGIVKSYEKRTQSLQKRVKRLEEEKELMQLDMGSKPEVKDYRLATQRVKKLEKLLATHNISVPGEKSNKDPFRLKRKYSTRVEDLDYLPLDFCQQYLRDISTELGIDDIDRISLCMQSIKEELRECKKYEGCCRRIHNIVQAVDPGNQGSRGQRSSPKNHMMQVSDKNLQHDMFVVESWSKDIASMQELQLTINSLLDRLAPWARIHLTGGHSVEEIIDTLENVAEQEGSNVKRDGQEHTSRADMETIVEHFMTLFDVPSVAGVFPRMTELYTKLGEVHNVMNTLRNILSLGDDSKSSAVVDSVGRLCQAHNSTTAKQLKQLLQTDDLDGVIRRLDEHRKFFPPFQELTKKLLQILGIERMDQIVPAVRALKMLSH